MLDKEIVPESSPLTASVEYRKSLAISLFYKVDNRTFGRLEKYLFMGIKFNVVLISFQFYLALLGDKANERVRSAAFPYIRPISSGKQSYDTTPSVYPLTKPMTKITAKFQVLSYLEV